MNIELVSVLSNTVVANAEKAGKGFFDMGTLMIVGAAVGIYFLMYRPQKQQQKKKEEMKNSLKKGDKILLDSGIYGKVMEFKDPKTLKIEIAPKVVILVDKSVVHSKTSNSDEDSEVKKVEK